MCLGWTRLRHLIYSAPRLHHLPPANISASFQRRSHRSGTALKLTQPGVKAAFSSRRDIRTSRTRSGRAPAVATTTMTPSSSALDVAAGMSAARSRSTAAIWRHRRSQRCKCPLSPPSGSMHAQLEGEGWCYCPDIGVGHQCR